MELRKLYSIALVRLRLLAKGLSEADSKAKLIFLTELANLGFEVTNTEEYNDSLIEQFTALIETLRDLRGGAVDYVPLFQDFPEDTPDDDDYFVRRIISFFGSVEHVFEDGHVLENGMVIPEWLFDLEKFGADPITQFQDTSLFKKGVVRQKKRKEDEATNWIPLRIVDGRELEITLLDFLKNTLYAKSSVREALKPDIEYLLGHFGAEKIDPERVVFKETRASIMKYYWLRSDFVSLAPYCSTPTDLLRTFAAVTESDIALSEPIKFPKFRRNQRRFILSSLEKCSNLLEDLLRYKGLWLELGRFLHPAEYEKRYPLVFKAFHILRNEKAITFNSKLEKALNEGALNDAIQLLRSRPGVFARNLHQLLEIAKENNSEVLDSFREVATQVPLKNLLVLETYFRTIGEQPIRTVINKRGKIRVLPYDKPRLATATTTAVLEVIVSALRDKIGAEKGAWNGNRVWIDQSLQNYTVPLQQRKASDGLLVLGRGSKIPLDAAKVLRLSVYWKQCLQTTDLDLSVIKFGEHFNYEGHVSYTQLRHGGIAHSGDIQSAPHGAAEFVDIDLNYIKKKEKCRYLAPQVYKYCGEPFANLDQCISGWMLREKVDSNYKTFDVKTVQQKFELVGNGTYCIPILIDLKKDEITFVDLYVNGVEIHNRVEGAIYDISTMTSEMLRMIDTRPNMYELACHHVHARGAQFIDERQEADITIGLKDCDYSVDGLEKILAELI